MFKMFSDKSRRKQHLKLSTNTDFIIKSNPPIGSCGGGGDPPQSSLINQNSKEYHRHKNRNQSNFNSKHNSNNHHHHRTCELSSDTGLCSGSECCSCSISCTSSSSTSPINQHIPTSFINFNEFNKKTIAQQKKSSDHHHKKFLNSKITMNDNETLITELTSTMSSDECPDESLSFEHNHHHQSDNSNQIATTMDDYNDQDDVEETEFEENDNNIDDDDDDDDDKNIIQWALVSKHDNFQLKIDAEENYVCFIGTDNVDCHLLLRRYENNNDDQDKNLENPTTTMDGRQAVLIYANGGFHLKDLNSSYGTYINERRVPSRCFVQLNENDEIRFGFSSDVYQIKKILVRQQQPQQQSKTTIKKLVSAADDDSLVIEHSPPKSTKNPMNKLFFRSNNSKSQSSSNQKIKKQKVLNNKLNMIIQQKDIDCNEMVGKKNSTSKSKLSPSSFSLMSSSSSNSSSSTSASTSSNTSPSSVFMSAMKMMKMRFKKKSSSSAKDHHSKTMICSGNDDITFIRYDDDHNLNHQQQKSILPQSVSAPESPNQPRSRVYHSHTYQNEYPHPRKLSAYQIGLSFDEEHEYDEVTRENDIDTTTTCSDQQSTIDEQRMLKEETEMFQHESVDGDHYEDNDTLCRKTQMTNNTTSNKFYIDPKHNDDDHSFDLIIDNKNEQRNSSTPPIITSTSATTTTTMLPHLNSEDRLNNNSSLDALISDSLIIDNKNKCEMENNNESIIGTCSSTIQQQQQPKHLDEDYEQQQHHHMPETIEEDYDDDDDGIEEVVVEEDDDEDEYVTNTDETNSKTVGSSNKVASNINLKSTTNNNSLSRCSKYYHQHHQQHCGKVCQKKEDSFLFEKPSNNVLISATPINTSPTSSSLSRREVHSEPVKNFILDNNPLVDEDDDDDLDGEYDIDNIGHLRRPISSSNTTTVTTTAATSSTTTTTSTNTFGKKFDRSNSSRSGNICDSLNCSTATLLPINNEHFKSSSLSSSPTSLTQQQQQQQDNDRSRHSIGGMAFVIDFNEDNKIDNKEITTKNSMFFENNNKRPTASSSSSASNHRRRHTFCERNKSSCLDAVDGDEMQQQQSPKQQSMIRLNSKRNRNMINTNNNKTLNDNVTYVMGVGNPQQQQQQDIPHNYDDAEHCTKILPKESSSTNTSTPPLLRRSDTFEKKVNKLTSETSSASTLMNHNNNGNNISKNLNKNSFEINDTSSKASSSTSTNRRRHGSSTAQLSESAVYLINRMFEDSDSYLRQHHQCYNATNDDPQEENSNQYIHYANVVGGGGDNSVGSHDYYGSHRSHRSSGSESPYGGMRFNRTATPTTNDDHIPMKKTMQTIINNNSNNLGGSMKCNSSNASTRMEYDDSLSSLHSNSDSVVQLSSMSHLQSMSTVVPLSSSSNQSLTTNMDKHGQQHQQQQVDSAIDDDADDLIPDDISETGTYVVEIDEQGQKHRKPDSGSVITTATIINNDKPQITKSNELVNVVRSSDEDLPGHETDYDEDFDYDEEEEDDDVDDDDEEEYEEDKLEVARKQIDELFSNYEKNQTQQQQNKICPTTTFTNNATFTKSKRHTGGNISATTNDTNHRQYNSFNQNNSNSDNNRVDDKCPPISIHFPANHHQHNRSPSSTSSKSDAFVITSSADKSKKRISSELMSAFKRINSKLEKTARLGKLSLTSGTSSVVVDAENNSTPPNSTSNISVCNLQQQSRSPIPGNTNVSVISSSNSKPPLKCRSAPGTPNLSSVENRKFYISHNNNNEKRSFNNNINNNNNQLYRYHRKSSITSTDCSSTEKLDDNQKHQPLQQQQHNQPRARSESITSTTSNQSSNLRFNRAFALRRARLGMDTCGVEISEQAACKAKESQEKFTPAKKLTVSSPFRRNDGGRFSLRAPTTTATPQSAKTSRISRTPSTVKPTPNVNNKPPTIRKCSKLPPTPPSTMLTTKIPNVKSYSTSSSVCSSNENLCKISNNKNKINESKVIHKRTDNTNCLWNNTNNNSSSSRKISHSDNEIILDGAAGGDSSCDESVTPVPSLFNRFGRSSLRCGPTTSSTPWLKSLKANNNNNNQTQNSAIAKQYNNLTHLEKTPVETSDLQSPLTPPISGFPMSKRLFAAKSQQQQQQPRMSPFDKEFNSIVGRSASANSSKIVPDPNLMTHSVTESLLSRNNNSLAIHHNDNKSNEHPQTSSALTAISPSINARIFSISPLDSLVISAINQLSSKLRTRMRNFLEQERSNHMIGSEARSLIDEILPQISNLSCSDTRSSSSKSAFNHESSNISRDLSNILKNLKKVEQIFDVFSMLQEPNVNCQEIISTSSTSNNNNYNSPIITNASDSDTSGGENSIQTPKSSTNIVKPLSSNKGFRFIPISNDNQQQQQQSNINLQSPPSSASSSQPRSGFFIEI